MKLLMLRGLPASGKSTYAKELTKDGWVRTNKDELRAMLHGGKWSKQNEKMVCDVRDQIIMTAFEQGRNVVVDDTNYAPVHKVRLEDLATKFRAEFEIKDFDTDVEECIKRDLVRPNSVGEQVIRKMWRQYVAPVQQYKLGSDRIPACIVDIDGTIALMNGRGPFEWDKVDTDRPNHLVVDLVRSLGTSFKIVIMSGRDGSCRRKTEEWLEEYGIPYDELLMRPEGDSRKDVLIKEELFDSIKDKYEFYYVIDDRPQVCRMWHTLGLTLLKVGDPDVEF